MTRTDAALARIRRDYDHGRITGCERDDLWRAVQAAAAANRNPFDVLDRHARMRSA